MTDRQTNATDEGPRVDLDRTPNLLTGGVELPTPPPTLAVVNDEEAPDLASSTERYALRFAGATGHYLLERQARGIRQLLALTGATQLRVLDVGGGHLQIAATLAPLGHRVVVHGTSAACLHRLPALAQRHPDAIEARISPLWDLPAGDGEFDLVVAIRMLGHVSRWRELLAEICRASRRWVLLEFAGASGAQRFSESLFGLKRRLEGDTRHFTTYHVVDVAAELERQGFRIVAVDRQFTLPIVFHRVLGQPALSRAVEHACGATGLTKRIGSPVLMLAERRQAANGASPDR